ncbi:hypothetical protein ACRE_003590 [Hapsidospora chrysogenum ATCC 11550]|uniref:Uncharacterized protein n=1 Tax=Hapsidospora chrysogenum (strain ATCC 11550 / CBS 779.69 / DSM 880 / IAM 14645 / JCM 23072 / IMI 49137) TaxID=857340 RepID=A0A086TH16_HAPC1|nr:hypothetical protein ACRE_003590 [Hapsidospora chrysogenum ATCC 11550]
MLPRARALTLRLGVEAICGNLEKPRAKKDRNKGADSPLGQPRRLDDGLKTATEASSDDDVTPDYAADEAVRDRAALPLKSGAMRWT